MPAHRSGAEEPGSRTVHAWPTAGHQVRRCSLDISPVPQMVQRSSPACPRKTASGLLGPALTEKVPSGDRESVAAELALATFCQGRNDDGCWLKHWLHQATPCTSRLGVSHTAVTNGDPQQMHSRGKATLAAWFLTPEGPVTPPARILKQCMAAVNPLQVDRRDHSLPSLLHHLRWSDR